MNILLDRCQVAYTEPQVSDLSKPSADTGKFLSDTKYAFTLQAHANGTSAPTVVTKEVDMAVAGSFVLAKPDFSNAEMVKAYVYAIVAPAINHWKETMERDNGRQERASAGAN
jgi:hypothetical protein